MRQSAFLHYFNDCVRWVKMLPVLFIGLTFISCQSGLPKDLDGAVAYLSDPRNGLTLEQQHKPFNLQITLLPEAFLAAIHKTKPTVGAPTVSFRLKVSSLQNQDKLSGLLLQESPTGWTRDQVQTALLYHLDNVATLHIGNESLRPIMATAEANADMEQQASIIFVFSIPEAKLHEAPEVQFVLDGAFFLPTPVSFTFRGSDLKTVL